MEQRRVRAERAHDHARQSRRLEAALRERGRRHHDVAALVDQPRISLQHRLGPCAAALAGEADEVDVREAQHRHAERARGVECVPRGRADVAHLDDVRLERADRVDPALRVGRPGQRAGERHAGARQRDDAVAAGARRAHGQQRVADAGTALQPSPFGRQMARDAAGGRFVQHRNIKNVHRRQCGLTGRARPCAAPKSHTDAPSAPPDRLHSLSFRGIRAKLPRSVGRCKSAEPV